MILISGPEAGVPFAMSDLRAAKQAAPQTPVLANTGVTADRLAETLAVADGVIVGTSLKVDGITWNPVDPARAGRFMDTARQARSAPACLADPPCRHAPARRAAVPTWTACSSTPNQSGVPLAAAPGSGSRLARGPADSTGSRSRN